jgi:hypothetical protein
MKNDDLDCHYFIVKTGSNNVGIDLYGDRFNFLESHFAIEDSLSLEILDLAESLSVEQLGQIITHDGAKDFACINAKISLIKKIKRMKRKKL